MFQFGFLLFIICFPAIEGNTKLNFANECFNLCSSELRIRQEQLGMELVGEMDGSKAMGDKVDGTIPH